MVLCVGLRCPDHTQVRFSTCIKIFNGEILENKTKSSAYINTLVKYLLTATWLLDASITGGKQLCVFIYVLYTDHAHLLFMHINKLNNSG